MAAAVQACREALGDALADELGALPENARIDADDDGVARLAGLRHAVVHARARRGRGRAARGRHGRRLVFGHTHLQFQRPRVRDGIELLNPGSVGIPLDGDHRAAYALLAQDGSVELRRVEYDWRASAEALRDRYGDASGSASSPAGSSARASPRIDRLLHSLYVKRSVRRGAGGRR